jgi:prepilin-type N-terminal cleavage/methylation domain-containing protein
MELLAGFGLHEKKSQSGVSMIEVLVAIAIFAIGSLMVLTMTTSSLRVTSNSRTLDEGTNLARTQMETLLGLDYNDGQLLDVNADGAAGLLAESAAGADYNAVNGRFLVAWNVAADVPVNGAKTLAVIVSSQENTGTRRVVFETVISE